MAAKKRSPRKLTKRTPRKVAKNAPTLWTFILITDLHVSAKTIDLVLAVLARVREIAKERGLHRVICLGDFWDARNILSVRHVHMLMDEFARYQEDGILFDFIPGNHDQVSLDGHIHGVRVFEQYDNVTIATNPIYDHDLEIVLLPWREDTMEQAQLFSDVPDGYTVFAHAEAPGSLANSGKKMEGKFKKKDLKRLRAVYLGHFHKRQAIGDNCWYIGNPFEKDFSEMGDPKGMAIVTRAGSIEPEWIPFDEFPKHFRLHFPEDAKRFVEPGVDDIVEVYASREDMQTAAYAATVAKTVATDVRKLPLPDPKKSVVPAFALGIKEAISEYAASPESWAGLFKEDDVETLSRMGEEILAQVPDAGTIVPLAKKVTPVSVTVHDFCAIKGSVHLDLRDQGTLLLQGEMGVGKTSICDAMTWALYDKTTPRKAGSSGASLRADDVIHDDSDTCSVSFKLLLDDKHEAVVTREKRRGKGSKVDLQLPAAITMPSGISDQQDLVHKVIGIDYELWRTCVYLGQGSVGNFITDADKKRKELLSRAFQLGACRSAQKLVRGWMKELKELMAPVQNRIQSNKVRAETLKAADFSTEMKTWEERRAATISQSEQAIKDAQARVATLDEKLEQQAQWEESAKQHEEHVARLEAQLTASSVPERAGKIHAAIGAAQAEKSIAERDLGLLRKGYNEMQARASGSSPVCAECGQVIPLATFEQNIAEIETKIQNKSQELQNFEHSIANHQQKLGQLTMDGGADVEALKRQLTEARANLMKVRQGLDALHRIRSERDTLAKSWEEARKTIQTEKEKANPFKARQEQKEAQMVELKAALDKDETELRDMLRRLQVLGFWEDGFGAKGVPVLVLRTVLHELETHANRFLAKLTEGKVFAELEMLGDDLKTNFFKFETDASTPSERSFLQLSGGERRCAEMAFSPFALSEMIFTRTGVRIPMLVVDELTTHLSPKAKPQVCSILRDLGRDTVVVIDHDPSVQGEFDLVYSVEKESDGSVSTRRV